MSLDSVSELHERLFTIDTHCDTPTARLVRTDWDLGERHDYAIDGSQCDLPRMVTGGVDAMVFAVYAVQAARTGEGRGGAHEGALACLRRTHAVIAEQRAHCGLALSAADGLRLKAEGKRAIFLSLENAYSLGIDAGHVEKFYRRGVRMIGLTHMLNNDIADASTDPRGAEWGGLSPLGREVVAECNRWGVVLDASHASDAALDDLLGRSAAPVVLSHSGPRAICDHPRNVGDRLLRALAARGGVLHINALPISLVTMRSNRRTAATAEVMLRFAEFAATPEMLAAADLAYDRVAAAYPNPAVTLADFIRHVEYAVELMGIDHVGIGADLDGGGGGFTGLRDVSDYPNITRALRGRGWRESDLEKLWGANTLRVLRAAEALAH